MLKKLLLSLLVLGACAARAEIIHEQKWEGALPGKEVLFSGNRLSLAPAPEKPLSPSKFLQNRMTSPIMRSSIFRGRPV